MSNEKELRVWWIPQVPMQSFYVNIDSVSEGVKIMEVLAEYDRFQFENNIKPDYSNVGGLQMFDVTDETDSPNGSWCDWYDEETGESDPEVFISKGKSDGKGL